MMLEAVCQTIVTFRQRWNNYKDNKIKYHRSENCMQDHLFRHFSSKGNNRFLNDASIAFIDQNQSSKWYRMDLRYYTTFNL